MIVAIILFCLILRRIVDLVRKAQAEKAAREKALERERIAREKAIEKERIARERMEKKIRQELARQEREQERIKKEIARQEKQLRTLTVRASNAESEIDYYEPLLHDLQKERQTLVTAIEYDVLSRHVDEEFKDRKRLQALDKKILTASKKIASASAIIAEYDIAKAS